MNTIQVEVTDDLKQRIKRARWYNRLKTPSSTQAANHHNNMFWIGIYLLHAAQDDPIEGISNDELLAQFDQVEGQ